MADPLAPHAHRFESLDDEAAAVWAKFGNWDEEYFATYIGLEVEEIRRDYARIRLPWRPFVAQAAGVAHGGAIASLIDTVVVPAVGAAYPPGTPMSTIALNVQYLGAVVDTDAVAEGWVERRGRSVVFCRAEVRIDEGELVATANAVYKVSRPRS